MVLSDRVRIGRRFLRSIRIDCDIGDAASLEGFVCPQSSADVLLTMARHVSETGQGAYTWTGPYGSGKSSLVVALSALLNGNARLQGEAARVFGQKLTHTIRGALPTGTRGWRILPVVARRDDPVAVIGEAVKRMGLVSRKPRGGWTETNLIAALTNAAGEKPRTHGGLVVFIDEMGKFLEAAAQGRFRHLHPPATCRGGVAEQWALSSRWRAASGVRGICSPPVARNARRMGEDSGPFHRSHRQHSG